jgi:hypothetical protein
MYFWDLIIDNNIKEAIAYLKDPIAPSEVLDPDHEASSRSNLFHGIPDILPKGILPEENFDYSISLEPEIKQLLKKDKSYSAVDKNEKFCTQVHFLTAKYKNER